MPVEARSDWTVADWLVASAIAAMAVMVAWLIRTNFHLWGDDFSLYALQAKAIGSDSLRSEVALNTRMLELSDVQVGPPAAPWGFPVMLWLAAKLVGWHVNELKVVGILSLGLFAGSSYVLARNYFSRLGSAAAAIFLALQPPVLALCDTLGSDVPFLAASGVALVAGEWLVRASADENRVRPLSTVLASVLTVAAFSIRSQGAFLAVATFSILAYSAVASTGDRRRSSIYELALYTLTTSALVLLYFRVFPDGTLGQAHSLTMAPQVLERRLVELAASAADFVPFSLMRRLGILSPMTATSAVAVGAVLFAIGAWRHRERSSGLVAFTLLNVALLLTFPVNGGARYLFPVLLPAVVLCGAGLASVLDGLRRRDGFAAVTVRLAAAEKVALAASMMGMLAIIPIVFHGPPDYAISGPLTSVADSLFTFIQASVPPGKTVSFFKPRALRMFTGRLGIAITRPENLGRADYVILDKRVRDGKWQEFFQLDRQTVESYDQGHFGAIYENGQFVVFGARQR